ncbi:hypothetical protein DNTS_035467 [Danionella cerebrum]|uniref:Immunoglobulin V-set domain-containing protein n=1 Tax=Danionella cerebrum TaxID=2873325 RepID=A0A553R629_9TELE|nr:hypothetical protein DNTS_035467 [Danionella translucida]
MVLLHLLLLAEIPAVLGGHVEQEDKVIVKGEGKTANLPCKVTDLNMIHWYQVKDGEAPLRLNYIKKDGTVTIDTNNPQANDFTVDKTQLYDLKLEGVQRKHAAVYFCAYWETGHSERICSPPAHQLEC